MASSQEEEDMVLGVASSMTSPFSSMVSCGGSKALDAVAQGVCHQGSWARFEARESAGNMLAKGPNRYTEEVVA